MLMMGSVASVPRKPAAPALPTDATVDIAAQSTGSLGANAFTGFLNYAGSSITTDSLGNKVMRADTAAHFTLKTTGEARDVEVECWSQRAQVFFRLTADGSAICVRHNVGVSLSNTVMVYIARGVNETGTYEANATFYHVASYDLTTAGVGFDASDMVGDVFTYGVSGFEVYLKFNGVEFGRVTLANVWHMDRGIVAFQNSSGSGFRGSVVVNWLSDATIYSYPPSNLIDLRDFGVRAIQTTGSINIGVDPNILTIASNPGFAVGDQIIVEVGGETGAGARGTRGVGGANPSLSYANDTAMTADTSKPTGTRAWAEDTGRVRRYLGGGTWEAWQSDEYYFNTVVPKALVTTITGIAGTTITLADAAAVSTTNANVYLNNSPAINEVVGYDSDLAAIAPTDIRLRLPAGVLGSSGVIQVYSRDDWTVFGAGIDKTTLICPEGAEPGPVQIYSSDRCRVQDFAYTGNGRDNGYMLFYLDTTEAIAVPWPYGLMFSLCSGGEAHYFKSTDVFQMAVGTEYCTDVWAYRCVGVSSEGHQFYAQWQFQWTTSTGGGCADCDMDAAYNMPGYEAFLSTNITFTRCTSTNATVSSNGSSNTLFDECDITLEENCEKFSDFTLNPIVNFNENAGASGVCTWRNGNIVFEGYMNAGHALTPAFQCAHSLTAYIEGTYPDGDGAGTYKGLVDMPDWFSGTNSYWGVGARFSDGTIHISGIRFTGATSGAAKGKIHTETGGAVYASDYVADSAASGPFVVSDTGRQTNADWLAAHP